MLLTDFTTYADIRAALGVSVDEISDAVVGLDVYVFGVRAELYDLDSSIISDFATVKDIVEGSRTEDQQNFYASCVLFTTYAAAFQLTESLPLFAPKTISDGKALMTRYSDSPYKPTVARIEKAVQRYRVLLSNMYAIHKGSTAAVYEGPTLIAAVGLATDPITNEAT